MAIWNYCTLRSYIIWQQMHLNDAIYYHTAICMITLHHCSLTATPSAGSGHKGTGDECPEGHYCPRGTVLPIPCPPGQYNFVPSM